MLTLKMNGGNLSPGWHLQHAKTGLWHCTVCRETLSYPNYTYCTACHACVHQRQCTFHERCHSCNETD